jgi:predicted phage-related endonuclease
MADIVTIDPDAAWHGWRRGGIGGSDIAGIIGISRWASPWSVWADKVQLRQPTGDTQRQRIGKRMEHVLAAEFNEETGLYVAGEQTWCWDPEHPHRRCTVDGFVYEEPNGKPCPTCGGTGEIMVDSASMVGIPGGLIPDRCPTCSGGRPHPWDSEPEPVGLCCDPHERFGAALGGFEAKTDGRRSWPDGVPVNIRAQCVWNMGVTKLPHWWLVVMFAGFRVEVFELAWDADAQADFAYMAAEADRFWHDHVLTGVAPDIDGSDATTYALKAVYPEEEPGARAALDPDDVELLGNLKAEAKHTAAELKAVENRLRAQFGDAEIGTIGGRAAYTLRAQTRRTECKACHHVEESEPFRVLRPAPAKLRDLPAFPEES